LYTVCRGQVAARRYLDHVGVLPAFFLLPRVTALQPVEIAEITSWVLNWRSSQVFEKGV